MNQTLLKRRWLIAAFALSSLSMGCASVAVTDDAINQNTAHALGLDPGAFKVSDRVDDGIKSRYLVTTESGRRFDCYVTGTVSVIGRVVSDAMCTEKIQSGKPASDAGPPPGSCNALLKASGRC